MTDTKRRQSAIPWLFLAIAFGWTWTFWVPFSLQAYGLIKITPVLSAILMDGAPGAWGPLIAAIIVAFRTNRHEGVKALWSSMTRFRFGLLWYVIALLLLPVLVGSAQFVAWAFGETIPVSDAFANPISIPIAFIWIFFLGGPLQEEAGWRGTATPTIENRVGALAASLVTGFLWAIWHLPLFFQQREEVYYNGPFWGLLVSTMLLSVLLTWVYKNTGRSLFAAMLMHTSWNWSNYLFTGLQTDNGGLSFLILLVVTVVVVALLPARATPKNHH